MIQKKNKVFHKQYGWGIVHGLENNESIAHVDFNGVSRKLAVVDLSMNEYTPKDYKKLFNDLLEKHRVLCVSAELLHNDLEKELENLKHTKTEHASGFKQAYIKVIDRLKTILS